MDDRLLDNLEVSSGTVSENVSETATGDASSSKETVTAGVAEDVPALMDEPELWDIEATEEIHLKESATDFGSGEDASGDVSEEISADSDGASASEEISADSDDASASEDAKEQETAQQAKPLTPEEEKERYFASLKAERRKRSRRFLIALSIVGVLIAGVYIWIMEFYINGWHTNSGGRYYMNHNHRLVGMQVIGGKTYLFDNDGYLINGPAVYDGNIYYSSANGLLKGRVLIDGEEYWFDETDGILRRGFYEDKGNQYFRNSHGFVEDGIREINGNIYFISNGGRLMAGWAQNENGLR